MTKLGIILKHFLGSFDNLKIQVSQLVAKFNDMFKSYAERQIQKTRIYMFKEKFPIQRRPRATEYTK